MAVILTDGEALSPRLRLCSPTRSRSALAQVGVSLPSTRLAPLSGNLPFQRLGDGRDVLGRVAAAAAGNIDQSCPRKVGQIASHVLRPQIEPGLREGIRQSGIRV